MDQAVMAHGQYVAGTSLVKPSLDISSLDVPITDSPDLYGLRLNRGSLDGPSLKSPRHAGQYHNDPSLVKAQSVMAQGQ